MNKTNFYCTKCGTLLQTTERFCPICGTNLATSPPGSHNTWSPDPDPVPAVPLVTPYSPGHPAQLSSGTIQTPAGSQTAQSNQKSGSSTQATPGAAKSPVVFYVIVLIGLGLITVGAYMLVDTVKFLPGTVSAQGTIVSCQWQTSTDSQTDQQTTSCFPTISFRTQTGQQITFTAQGSDSSFHEGVTLGVRYHPDNPRDARIDSDSLWLNPLVFLAIGLVVILLALGGIRRRAGRRA